ncbi:hypothetical protein ZWY2020_003450 [Hordeum vulgare]|nr:hypothetical protein ZWY2020_003450 [Hordeum vulgare]
MAAACPCPNNFGTPSPTRTTSGESRPLAARCGMREKAQVEGWCRDDDDPRKSRPRSRSCPCGRGSPWRPMEWAPMASIAGTSARTRPASFTKRTTRRHRTCGCWDPGG